jgi:L-fuculose-phosphate aldolase
VWRPGGDHPERHRRTRPLTPEAICVIDLEGKRVDGRLVPSSEVPMHTLVYQSTDAAAVVHTHPLYASTLSVLVNELPAVQVSPP